MNDPTESLVVTGFALAVACGIAAFVWFAPMSVTFPLALLLLTVTVILEAWNEKR